MGASPVMLSAAKHLAADRDRPFAALRACPERSEGVTQCVTVQTVKDYSSQLNLA